MATLSRSAVEDLLYAEALILDERRYDAWLAMLTADAIYWIPSNGPGRDPTREIAIVYDDFERLSDRVRRLESGLAHAQSPPSQTRRLIGNVTVAEAQDNAMSIGSNFLLYHLRRGRERIFAGRYEHRLRCVEGVWKIAAKKVVLVNNDEVIDNLTFIV
ncbi:MAG TPA: aromatic-ring-hydroxylating dioxygenase subunit beta [Candidatus Binataceae bacterium]|jgi:benzoate/toluate 1,2-dioxygenase beta subunit|nr:aromatic-ring-hydroxylating dioxygenase subunit beta [Candidatus Binataceae bacterium]